ncbi:putative integral membrane protein [Acanthocheilonema viteae]
MNGPMLNFIIFCTLLEIISAITFSSFNSNMAGASSLNSNANTFGGGAGGGISQTPFGGFGLGNPFSLFGGGFGFSPFSRGFGYYPYGYYPYGYYPYGYYPYGYYPYVLRYGRK